MELRQLTVADVPACMNVATDRDWTHSAATWRFLLELGTGWGVYDGDELAGTAVVTSYDGIASIGMVLVPRRYERQGIGGELMAHVLDSGVQCLYATSFGKALYERLGFHSVGQSVRYSGTFTGPASSISRVAEASDLPFIVDLDAQVFGAKRAELWERLLAVRAVRICPEGLVAWTVNTDTVIGPVIAPDPATAVALISDAAAGAGEVRVHLDSADMAEQLGLAPGSSCDLMVRNAPDAPGDRSRYFAPVTLALS